MKEIDWTMLDGAPEQEKEWMEKINEIGFEEAFKEAYQDSTIEINEAMEREAIQRGIEFKKRYNL